MIRRCLLILPVLLLFIPVPGWAVDYQVIVHASNPATTLSRDDLGKMFLKRLARWDSGTSVLPVDQAGSSPLRAVFTQVVHGKTMRAMSAYWQQQIFSGREIPPAEKKDDAAVIAFVRANPGAIGYVTGGLKADGVKAITIQ